MYSRTANRYPTSDPCRDGSFGPLVGAACPRGTDLTLFFQEAMLSLGPGVFMICIVFLRMVGTRTVRWWPSRKATSCKYWTKQGLYFSHLILTVSLLILRTRQPLPQTPSHPHACIQTSISFTSDLTSAAAVSFLILNASLEAATTSWSTSPRPITTYLMIGVTSDLIRANTLHRACTTANGALGAGHLVLGLHKFAAAVLELSRPSQGPSTCAEDDAGLFQRLVFGWLYSTIRKGHRARLQVADLPPTKQSVRVGNHGVSRDSILDESFPSVQYSKSKYTLHREVVKSIISSMTTPVLLRLLLLTTSLAQPMIIQHTLKFTESSQSRHGAFLVAGVVLVYAGAALLSGAYWHAVNSTVTRLRGLLFAIIYRRALLSESVEGRGGHGEMISLLSSDVDAVLQGCLWVHEIWATFITAAISMWMLHIEVGLAFLSPLVGTFAVTTTSSYLSKYLKSLQQKWLQSTAERSEYTLYALRNILGIKMSGMSGAISTAVLNYRLAEVKKSKQFRKMLSILLTLANASTLGITLATISTFAIISKYTGEELNATKMFTALAILQLPMSSLQTLVASVPLMGAAMASLKRIQEYLAERDTSNGAPEPLHPGDVSGLHAVDSPFQEKEGDNMSIFTISNGTIGWAPSVPLLSNFSFSVQPSEICCIFGQAGSGKSSLLSIIAGQDRGLASVTSITKNFARSAYCEQNPWLPNDTVQNVITGAERFDPEWFSHVLSLCCLTADMAQLAKGSNTPVGAEGRSLSGGQKKRVALARAIYSRNRVFLLDDPLGSLDTRSAHTIGEALFGPRGYFRSINATVVLTTGMAKHLDYADRVFHIQAGNLVEQPRGAGIAAVSSNGMHGLRVHDQDDTSVTRERCIHDAESSIVRNRAHEQLTTLESGPWPRASMREHKLYAFSLGKRNLTIFVLLSASIAAASLARSFELKRISQYYSHDAYSHLGIYIGLVSGTLALILCWNWHFYVYGVGTSSTRLHEMQWNALINSPMSFFTTTEQGEIMNSFTQDLRFVDKELPTALSSSTLAVFLMVVNILIAVLATKFTAIAVPFLGMAFWVVCRTYLRISYQVQILDLNCVSPIFNHAIETMQGFRTIHSFGWVDHFYDKFLAILDTSQRPYYTMFAVQQLLQVVLDLFVAVIAVITCSVAVALKESADTGMLGLALTSLMTLGGSLKLFVRSFTELETSIAAIGRINSFVDKAESEHDRDGCRHRAYDDAHTSLSFDNWPKDGSILFEEVTASYGFGKPSVLRNVSLKIPHGHRVAICGRSGSGKTSLVTSLFSLLNITSGGIVISNVPTTSLCVRVLRENIAGLPQDTFFLPGSVRDNFLVYHNRDNRAGSPHPGQARLEDGLTAAMVGSLRALGLYEKIAAAGGLDCAGIGLQALLSHGERQLFNLARLSITSSPIVVMDEATSSVDDEMEIVARDFIRERFKGKTIVGVVHRIGSLTEEDWDRYVLMDGGEVVETGQLGLKARGEKFVQLTTGSGESGDLGWNTRPGD